MFLWQCCYGVILGPAPVRTNLTIPQKIVYVLVAVTQVSTMAFITLSGDPIYNYESTPLHEYAFTFRRSNMGHNNVVARKLCILRRIDDTFL